MNRRESNEVYYKDLGLEVVKEESKQEYEEVKGDINDL